MPSPSLLARLNCRTYSPRATPLTLSGGANVSPPSLDTRTYKSAFAPISPRKNATYSVSPSSATCGSPTASVPPVGNSACATDAPKLVEGGGFSVVVVVVGGGGVVRIYGAVVGVVDAREHLRSTDSSVLLVDRV